MTFPLEQSEGLVSLLSVLGFFSNTVICRRGPQPQITGSGSVGLVCRGTAFGAQSWNFFNGNHMALDGQPLGGPISIKRTFTDTYVSSN